MNENGPRFICIKNNLNHDNENDSNKNLIEIAKNTNELLNLIPQVINTNYSAYHKEEKYDSNKTVTDVDLSMNSLKNPNQIYITSDLNNLEICSISDEKGLDDLLSTPNNSIDKNDQYNQGRWLPEEHSKFLEAMYLYGNEWKKVQEYIGTRSSTQARSHAQKFFIRLKKKYGCEKSCDEKEMKKKLEKIMSWMMAFIRPEVIMNEVKINF